MRNPEASEPKPAPQIKVRVVNKAQELAKDRSTEQVAEALLKSEGKMQKAISIAKTAGIAREVLFDHKQGRPTEDQKQAEILGEQELAKIIGTAPKHTGMAVSSNGMVLSFGTNIPGLTVIRSYDNDQAEFTSESEPTVASFEGLKQDAMPAKVSYEMAAQN